VKLALAVFTDGRHACLADTLAAFDQHSRGTIDDRHIFNDSPDPSDQAIVDGLYADRYTIHHAPARRGFGGTIAHAWQHLALLDVTHIVHLEDDFTLARPVDWSHMARTLDRQPNLAQLALRRQPWNDTERAAGGIIECWPDAYTDMHDKADWLEHRLFFTTNPSIYRRDLCALGWPVGERSEAAFSAWLFTNPETVCGYWGERADGPWCTHIGAQRAGIGY